MVNPDDRPPRRFSLRYNPEVTAGSVMIAILVVGVLITGYMWFRVDMNSQINAVRVSVSTHEDRLATAEHSIVAERDEERQFATEMRAAMVDILKSLNQLQLQLVEQANRKATR